MPYLSPPHSQFLDPDEYKELKTETEGKFGGLGIEISIRDGLLTIITPIEGTPAWKAGIKAGDRIVKIEDELTKDITLSEAVKKLRGKPKTDISITILRESESKILDFTITREIIHIEDVKHTQILKDNIVDLIQEQKHIIILRRILFLFILLRGYLRLQMAIRSFPPWVVSVT